MVGLEPAAETPEVIRGMPIERLGLPLGPKALYGPTGPLHRGSRQSDQGGSGLGDQVGHTQAPDLYQCPSRLNSLGIFYLLWLPAFNILSLPGAGLFPEAARL